VKKYLLFGALVAVLFALGSTSFVQSLNEKGTDILSPAGHFPHPDIVILAIDDKSLAAIGRWPWPRTVEAEVIKKLGQFSPRVLGLDVNFSDPEDPVDDAALTASMQDAAFPIVLPVETVHYANGQSDVLFPLDRFSSLPNVTLGNVDVSLASDGEARFLPGTEETPRGAAVPFAGKIAETAGATLPAAGKTYAINFAGPAGTFPTYSISDFLNGNVPAQALTEKIVLIGATANDLHDVVPVPVGSGLMSGVEWHANIVDNILLNRFRTVMPGPFADLAGAILVFALLILLLRVRGMIALPVTVGALVAVPAVSYFGLRNGLVIPYLWNEIAILVAFFSYGLFKWFVTEAEKRRIRRTVQNYFSPAVLDAILKNPKSLSLGGEWREVTVLFSDIRSFTTITERTPPETLTKLLNEYFTEMAAYIFSTDGVLDKFIGDAVMAFWGAPLSQPDHADRAMRAALGMIRRVKELQKKWADEKFPFVDIGIGIHTGKAMVGNMGSEKRFDYTVIGDTVNAASRLEGLNKEYKTHIIISEAVKEKLKDSVNCRALGDVTVKGKTAALKVYAVE
jgi:adenylate cyclase